MTTVFSEYCAPSASVKTCIHLPQREAVHVQPDERVVISIRNTGSSLPPLIPGWSNVLYLDFDDVRVEYEIEAIKQGYHVPTRSDCELIVEFAKKHEGKSILTHCWAGVSRSAATCLALEAMGWYLPDRARAWMANEIMLRHFGEILGVQLKRPQHKLWDGMPA